MKIDGNTWMSALTALIMTLVLLGCRSEDVATDTGWDLSEWSLLGPFPVDVEDDPYSVDATGLVGLEEADLITGGLQAALDRASADSLVAQHPDAFHMQLRDVVYVDFYNQFGMQASRESVQPVVYAETSIDADAEQSVYLLIASSAGPVLWINGEKVYAQPVSRSLFPYDDVVRVELQPGQNRLLFKIPRLRHHWGLRVRVEPSLSGAIANALAEQRSLQSFIWSQAVFPLSKARSGTATAVSAPILSPRGVPDGAQLDLRLECSSGEIVHRTTAQVGESWIVPEPLDEGLYRSIVSAGEEDYYEWIFIGDLWGSAAARLEQARHLYEPLQNANLRVLLRRIAIMLDSDNRSWQAERNLIYTLSELERIDREYREGADPYMHSKGLQVRGFVSDIDGQDQVYRLYIPRNYSVDSDKALPLVVLLPARTYEERPFISSVYMAGIVDAERMAAIAEENQVALLWSGFRNNLARQPCEVTHLREVLADVERHYRIDSDRVTLLGGCSGAGLSIDAIAAMPERFAGVGWMNPMYGFEREFPSERAFGRFPQYQNWRRSVDGYDSIFATGGPPIVIVHDGGEPGHGELHVAMRFVNEARANDYPVELLRVHQTWSEHYGALRQLVELLAEKRRDRKDFMGNEPQRNVSEKPTVFDVFAERFTVVSGTAGSDSDREQMERLVAEFQQTWQAKHFANARVAADVELTDLDQNLVILGNTLHNKTAADLNLDDWVQREKGTVVYSVLRNPLFPERLILWINASDPAHISLERPALPKEGWFQSAVWRIESNGLRLLEVNTRGALGEAALPF